MEQIKNYWNNQPFNINHSSKEFLSKEYFDEIEIKKIFCRTSYTKICRI